MNNKEDFFSFNLTPKGLMYLSAILARVAYGEGNTAEFKEEAKELCKSLYEQIHKE